LKQRELAVEERRRGLRPGPPIDKTFADLATYWKESLVERSRHPEHPRRPPWQPLSPESTAQEIQPIETYEGREDRRGEGGGERRVKEVRKALEARS
jgi:hypothetical protein